LPYTKDRSVWWNRRNTSYRDYPGHVAVVDLNGDVKKLLRSRTGENMKDWKERIRLQQNATTSLTGDFTSVNGEDRISWRLIHKNLALPATNNDYYTRELKGYHSPLHSIDVPVIGTSVASNRAAIAFLKKARAVQSEFSSPTFLGELRESLAMIRKPAQGLRNILGNYLGKVKNLKKAKPKEWKKNLSQTWLESVFGWMPLASSLKDGYDAYSKFMSDHDGEQKLISAIGIEKDNISETHAIQAINGFQANQDTIIVDKAFVKYYGCIVRRVDSTLRDGLARVGFNPQEFIPTAWELLPWSFLFDYFSNIGDVLGADAFVRSDLAWASSSTVTSRDIFCTTGLNLALTKAGFGAGGAWFVSATGEPARFQVSRRHVQRVNAVAISPPSFSLELPGNPMQWANMTALFAQANSISPQRGFRPR
jgi:hypothetical protein